MGGRHPVSGLKQAAVHVNDRTKRATPTPRRLYGEVDSPTKRIIPHAVSRARRARRASGFRVKRKTVAHRSPPRVFVAAWVATSASSAAQPPTPVTPKATRSEEHTSELQSRGH